MCTLPVTQVVSLMVAVYFVAQNPQLSWQEALGLAGFILVAFQLTPISPGSLVRGFYVLYLVIRERNFKDYNIAVFLGFFKYIGYLAFPIQMTYRYPALARFMAGHWATEAVHVVPVFGERGALLEHKIFSLFYNWPLTIRHRMHQRSLLRSAMPPRYWHVALCAIAAMAVFVGVDLFHLNQSAGLPDMKQTWGLALAIPLICGAAVTLGAGGAEIRQRIIGAVLCGVIVGVSSTVISVALAAGSQIGISQILVSSLWRVFVLTIFSVIGVLGTEILLPAPEDRRQRTEK